MKVLSLEPNAYKCKAGLCYDGLYRSCGEFSSYRSGSRYDAGWFVLVTDIIERPLNLTLLRFNGHGPSINPI